MPAVGRQERGGLPAWRTAASWEVAYAIGMSHPLSVNVETFGTGKVDDEKIEKAIREVFGLFRH